jgi:hypothetical protein
MHEKKNLILWKLSALKPDTASVRYRALLPALGLKAEGLNSIFTASARLDLLRDVRALVIVKSFSADDVLMASEARNRGVAVFFDLCDNIFIPGYQGKAEMRPAAMFQRIVEYCDAVVVPTSTLRDVVAARVPDRVAVVEIPDCAETEEERTEAHNLIVHANESSQASKKITCVTLVQFAVMASIRLLRSLCARARSTLTAHQPESMPHVPTHSSQWRQTDRPLLLWFGNRGNSYTKSGLGDLLVFKDALARANCEFNAELLVLSNSRTIFESLQPHLNIVSHYEDWTIAVMEEAFRRAAVVLVPNSVDEFSICKSANRTLLALKRGLPVVATPTRALEELKDCVWQADPYEGIHLFLAHRGEAKMWVNRAQHLLERKFSVQSLGCQWNSIIENHSIPGATSRQDLAAELFFTIGLAQDLDIVAPVLAGARKRGIGSFVYVPISLAQNNARVMGYLTREKIAHALLPDKFDADVADNVVSQHKAGFFPSETSLRPHTFSHRLCKFARSAGLRTFTIQHGIENVGLTYSDSVHVATDINILARTIFLWGATSTLHPSVADDVRSRCITVGCPKPAKVERVSVKLLASERRPIVGVFENLHWHRYSDKYREQFLDVISECAAINRHFFFLVKPHNAGMWLTARHKGKPLKASNILIADPAKPDWEHFTAPQLLGYCSCVVTTPSTVALDAARMGIPTALTRFGTEAVCYDPLTMIDTHADLTYFLRKACNGVDELQQLNRRFVNRHVCEGDAVARILDVIERQIAPSRYKSSCS